MNIKECGWVGLTDLPAKSFRCGYCGDRVASSRGYKLAQYQDGSGSHPGGVFVCPCCNCPSFIVTPWIQIPGELIGSEVRHVPKDVGALYDEARRAAASGCHTGAVLLCRKILLNLAVALGASLDLKFIEYVEYLRAEGYIPPNGKHWVDHIRQRGNEATHEIALMTSDDSGLLISFIEMLLRFAFEFPALVPTP